MADTYSGNGNVAGTDSGGRRRRGKNRKPPTAVMASPSQTGVDAYVSEKQEESIKPWKKKPQPPDDFDNEYDFMNFVRTEFQRDLEYDQPNRDEAVLDARFMSGDQWDETVRVRRNAQGKPTLTINRLPAFIEQLVGNRRMVDTGIKIIPDIGGTKKIAETREGLVRNIQKNSRAQFAYDKAFEQQVIGGIGNFQVLLDYSHDDVFEQDIKIAAIPDPLAVVWDRASVDPTGADAERVFVVDKIPKKDFERRWPDAQPGDFDSKSRESRTGWGDTLDANQVVSFWRMRCRTRVIAMLRPDGIVMDVTDLPLDEWWDLVMKSPNGDPMVRETQRKYAQMYVCSSNEILEGPYELPIQRVPVMRVPGWELFIEGDRLRWGVIRFARDPQKLNNYWRSVMAEKLVASPKNKWLAADSAVEGYEDAFRNSHLSDDPLLKWNAMSGHPPQRMPPIEIEPALLEQAGIAAQDIKDVLNIHEANLGMQSNEVSGRAIMARQRVGELGKVLYQDNLNAAIEECGKVINQLIPEVYDTPRMLKILGEDMITEQQVPVNGFEGSQLDITVGKYSVSVVTGPSYTTRRVEAREEMMAMVNAMPDTLGVAADLIIEAQDWPGADKIAKRMRSQMPANMLDPSDMTEEELQQAQAAAEAQQQQEAQQAELQEAVTQLELQSKQVEIALNAARIREAEARAVMSEAQALQAQAVAAKNIADIEQGKLQGSLDTLKTINEVENSNADNNRASTTPA